jgi:hypothetical protein
MAKPSKKHHYVPQAQLRHFASDAERRSIQVFNKVTGKSYPSSILNAGSENDFNTVKRRDKTVNFEDLFQTVDAASAEVVARLVETRSLRWITPPDLLAMADLIAVQLLRTKLARSTPAVLAAELREGLRALGIDPDEDRTLALPSEADAKIGTVRAFLDREGHRRAIANLVPGLWKASGEERFITSDHPVLTTNPFPYGDTGLTSQGVLVHLPISPTLMLTMHCPTTVRRLEMLADVPETPVMLSALRDALLSGQPYALRDAEVVELNRLQVAQAFAFLYADCDRFDIARELILKRPKLRQNKSLLHLGKIGEGPGRRPRMPTGKHLVVYGKHDHAMIAISEVDETGEGITAATTDIGVLRAIAKDPELVSASLYQDGYERRGMREVTVELLDERGDGWFRIVHSDSGMRDLDRITRR